MKFDFKNSSLIKFFNNLVAYRIVLSFLVIFNALLLIFNNDNLIFTLKLSHIFQIVFFSLLLLFSKKKYVYTYSYFKLAYKNIYFVLAFILLLSSIAYNFKPFVNIPFYFSILIMGFVAQQRKYLLAISFLLVALFGYFLFQSNLDFIFKKMSLMIVIFLNIAAYIILYVKRLFEKNTNFNENLFYCIFNKNSEAIIVVDSKTQNIIIANEAAVKLFKVEIYSRIVGKNIFSLLNKVEKEIQNEIIKTENWKGEIQIENKENNLLWLELSISEIHKDERHRIFKLVDITSKKHAKSVYQKIVLKNNLFSSIIVITNKELIIEYVNSTFLELTGYEESYIIGKSLHDKLFKYSPNNDIFINVLKGGIWNGESEVLIKNGETLYEKSSIISHFDDEGNITNFIKISEDLTIYKKAEQALKYSEMFNKGLIKTIPDIIFIFDENANFIDYVANDDETIDIKNNISKIILPEIKEITKSKIEHLKLKNEVEIFDLSVIIAGTNVYFDARMIALGKDKFLCTLRNITDKKLKEIELANSQNRYYTLFSNASDAILLIENDKFVECNDMALSVFDGTRDQILNKYPYELSPLYQEDGILSSEKAKQYIESALVGNAQHFNWLHLRISGEIFTAQISLNSFNIDNKQYVQVIIRDINEQKKQKDELQFSQNKLKENVKFLNTLLQTLPNAFFFKDINGKLLDCSESYCLLFNKTKEELIGKRALDLFQNDYAKISEERDNILLNTKERQVYENYIITETGNYLDVIVNKDLYYQPDGEIGGIIGVITNVTSLKETQRALIESQEKYYKLFNEAFDAILIMQSDSFIECNEKVLEMFDCTKNAIIGANFDKFLPIQQQNGTDSKILLNSLINDTINGKPKFATFELISLSNTVFWVELSISSFVVENNTYVQFIIREITERILSEEKIRTSEKNYRNLIDSSPTGIMITNLKKVYFVNESALSILGFENETELRKYNLFNYILPEYKEKIDEYLELTNKGIDTPFFEIFLKHPISNEVIEIEAKAAMFDYNNRRVYQLVLRDLSLQKRLIQARLKAQLVEESNQKLIVEMNERLNAEERLKKSLLEKDVLLKEVHHRVKNNMQIISSILNLQASYIKDSETKEMFQESQDRIKSMALIHENLYRNEDLSKINFSDYMVNLVNNLYRSYNIDYNKIKLNLDVQDILFNLDVGIPCGLIVNELISNSLKYAFDGLTNGNIFIKLVTEGELVNLTISDDGKGIDKKLDIYNTNSLGLQLVTTLVDQIDGKIELSNNKGTQFKITFKK